MKGYIIKSGGGDPNAAEPYAIILAEYPAGSACICTNGSETLEAANTLGAWAFYLPEGGTWTVTATAGSKSKSADVSITAAGQTESVALSFETVLYEDGTLAAIAGNLTAHVGYGNPDWAQTPNIKAKVAGYFLSGWSLWYYNSTQVTNSEPLDLSEASKLCFAIEPYEGNADRVTMDIIDSGNAVLATVTAYDVGKAEIDISSLTSGRFRITGGTAAAAQAANGYVTVSRIWLE